MSNCEFFLTLEELDEVQYDEKASENRGKNDINTEYSKDNCNGTEGAAEKAGKAVDGNKEGLGNKPKEDEDKKKPEPAAA